MESEIARLNSFVSCLFQCISPSRLSRSGFFYGGNSNKVVCFECHQEFEGWTTVDEVLQQHRVRSPTCLQSGYAGSENMPHLANGGALEKVTVSVSHRDDHKFQARRQALISSMASQKLADRSNPDFVLRRSESARLETFYDWPEASARIVDPRDLVKAGLFYTGEGDRVQCAFCRSVLRDWVQGDKPMDECRRHYTHCKFVRVTREHEATVVTGASNRRQDIYSSPATHNRRPTARNVAAAANDDTVDAAIDNSGHYLIADGPSYGSNAELPDMMPQLHNYNSLQARVRSFQRTSTFASNNPSSEALADAGFYYVGPDDNVRCFQCDGGLKNWQPTDYPWTEHARWFPNCPFVLTNNRQSPPGLAAGSQSAIQDRDSSTNTAASTERGAAATAAALPFPAEINQHPSFRVECMSEFGKPVTQVVDDG